jgi:hypothetical protein
MMIKLEDLSKLVKFQSKNYLDDLEDATGGLLANHVSGFD